MRLKKKEEKTNVHSVSRFFFVFFFFCFFFFFFFFINVSMKQCYCDFHSTENSDIIVLCKRYSTSCQPLTCH